MNELETDRLKLRMWRESDLDDYAELTSDPQVMRFLPPGKPFTRADAWRSMAFFIGHWHLRGYGHWAGGGRALQYAFKELDQRHVISLIHPENTPSIRVAERLRERREGTFRLGEWDVLVYGIDRP